MHYSTLIYCVNTFVKDLDGVQQDGEATGSGKIVKREPSEVALKNIFDFARFYDVVETESAGYVEMILN